MWAEMYSAKDLKDQGDGETLEIHYNSKIITRLTVREPSSSCQALGPDASPLIPTQTWYLSIRAHLPINLFLYFRMNFLRNRSPVSTQKTPSLA